MKIEHSNWMDVENYLKKEDRIILVLGTVEQHGYLSLLTDSKIPEALADALTEKTGVLVAPTLHYGVSPYFLTYPGSVSIKLGTYLALVQDIIRSFYGQGFRRFLILNGHGGNTPVRTALVELANDLPDLRINWYAWWTSPAVAAIGKKYQLETMHASWMEAFDFTRVCPMPAGAKGVVKDEGILNAARTRQTAGDGSYGGHYVVDDAIMQEMFAACLQEALTMLAF